VHLRSTSESTATAGTRLLALVAVAAVVAIWGLSGIAIKLTSTTGLVASFYRLWFAIPLLWSVAAGVPSIRRRINREWLGACLVGGVLFGLHQILFFTSIKFTSVANVTIIGALQPALVLLFAGRMFPAWQRARNSSRRPVETGRSFSSWRCFREPWGTCS